MDKFGNFVLNTLWVIIISIVTAAVTVHYMPSPKEDVEDNIEEVYCDTSVDKYDPVMSSVYEAFELRSLLRDDYEVDSIYRNVPEDALKSISNVLIGRNITFTKLDVITEYRNNYSSVYKYIKLNDKVPTTTSCSSMQDLSKTIPKKDSNIVKKDSAK